MKAYSDIVRATDGRSAFARDFLPVPDEADETGAQFFYFGWAAVDGSPIIQRQERATGLSLTAAIGALDFSAAWAARSTLAYS